MQDTTTSATPEDSVIDAPLRFPENYIHGPFKLQRNAYGLLENVDYKFSPDGFVNWRAMIEPEYLYPNKDWFRKYDQPVPNSIEGLEDCQLIIKIGGLNKLAAIRGFTYVGHFVKHVNDSWVYDECRIEWLPNYETDMKTVTYSYGANSNDKNCGDFMRSFKETQAEYRSQSLCIRKFLNINIVSDAEVDKSDQKGGESNEESAPSSISQSSLEKQANNAGFKTYEEFREKFLNPLAKSGAYSPTKKPESPWLSYADIPAEECRKIISLIKKNK